MPQVFKIGKVDFLFWNRNILLLKKFGFFCGSSGMKKWIETDALSERR